jgi:hypothetical protein
MENIQDTSVSTRVRDYATAEEIEVALAALQQVRRDLSLRKEANRAAEKRTIKEAARPQRRSPATADFRFRCHRKPAGDVGYGMPSAGRDVLRRRDGARTQRATGLLQRAVRMPGDPMAHTGRMGQSQIGKVLEHARRREHARESHRQYCLLRLYVCPARAFMMISRIAATAARQTSASSNGLPRSRSATACRYMSRRARGT